MNQRLNNTSRSSIAILKMNKMSTRPSTTSNDMGADTLLNYYQRTARQAYKNYRWNVVLARIFEAKGDLTNAAQQYHAALDNQPEMLELYDALAGVCTRAKDYDAALASLNKAAELSNDDPQYIKRIVEVLEKAGRHREAEIARQKLPR